MSEATCSWHVWLACQEQSNLMHFLLEVSVCTTWRSENIVFISSDYKFFDLFSAEWTFLGFGLEIWTFPFRPCFYFQARSKKSARLKIPPFMFFLEDWHKIPSVLFIGYVSDKKNNFEAKNIVFNAHYSSSTKVSEWFLLSCVPFEVKRYLNLWRIYISWKRKGL